MQTCTVAVLWSLTMMLLMGLKESEVIPKSREQSVE
jgi:hypothetical protein